MKPTDLMTANDVAKVAGVSPAAVRLWERTGKLPAEMYGRRDAAVPLRRRDAGSSVRDHAHAVRYGK